MDINWIAVSLFTYVTLQIMVAAFISRFIKTEADYLIGGRTLGVGLAAMSLFATWFGAETVMASSGAIAAEGLSGGRADPFGYATCLLLFAVFIAYKMRAGEYVTSGDFYRARYNAPTEKLGVAVQILTSLVWAAAQVLAFGHVMASVLGVELNTAIMICLCIVVAYTMLGGLLGDVLADTVQGVVLICGLLATLVFIVLHLGGWEKSFGTITLDQLALFNDKQPLSAQLDEWAIAILGSLTAQEAISRILATRSPDIARRAGYWGAGIYLVVGLIPAMIGLIGANILPVGDDSDNYLPRLAQMVLPAPVYVIFLGALASAILSTVDSTVLSISGLTTRNLVERALPAMSEKSKVRLQRGMVLVTGVLVYFIATAGSSIYELIELTSSFGSAGLLVVMLAGLWTGWGGPWTGFATVLAGIVLTWVTRDFMELSASYLVSIAGCVVTYCIMSIIEARRMPKTT